MELAKLDVFFLAAPVALKAREFNVVPMVLIANSSFHRKRRQCRQDTLPCFVKQAVGLEV